jgi:TolA-binding protein
MSLKIADRNLGIKILLSVFFLFYGFLLTGCGEVDEITKQEAQQQTATVAPAPAPQAEQEQPKAVKPMDQVLTNFIGEDAGQYAEVAPQPSPAMSPTQMAQYEKQIEEFRTENTTLKQKVVKLEQENRSLNAQIAEVEAKFTTEKLRADKAEDLVKGAVPVPKIVEEKTEEVSSGSAYDDALNAFRSKKFSLAAKKFKAIMDAGADDAVTNRSTYWLGETYFAQKKYKQALPLFQKVLKKGADKKADAQFMIAQSYDRLGQRSKAKAAYEKVVKNYPMSRNVKRAKARWAKL